MEADCCGSIDRAEPTASSVKTSIYSIVPISTASTAGGAPGDIFLSGGYDGNVRLHDLRTSTSTMAIYADAVDNSAVYSLLAFGRERFVAGASRHNVLKVFDLRMSGGKMYHYIDTVCRKTDNYSATPQSDHQEPREIANHQYSKAQMFRHCNYNMYLQRAGKTREGRNSRISSRQADSPVYSLSAPTSHSPKYV